jgi:hypothetical protein
MAWYFCIKLLEAAKSDTSDILYYYLEKTVELLGISKEEIIDSILSCFNKIEAQAIVQTWNYQNNVQEVNIKCHIQRILLFMMNTVAFELIKGYKEDIHQHNALAVTEATFKAKSHTETAEAVETVLANEDTISAQWMEDLLEKKLDKKLKKSFEMNDIEGRFEALQKSIKKLSKNSMASRDENEKKPAWAKKRKQNNVNNQQKKKKKKKVIELMSDSSSDSDNESSNSDDDSGNNSDSSEESETKVKTPPRKKLKFKQNPKKGKQNKKKKSKNKSWHWN